MFAIALSDIAISKHGEAKVNCITQHIRSVNNVDSYYTRLCMSLCKHRIFGTHAAKARSSEVLLVNSLCQKKSLNPFNADHVTALHFAILV